MRKHFFKQAGVTALCVSMALAGCSSPASQNSGQTAGSETTVAETEAPAETTTAAETTKPEDTEGVYTPGTYTAQADGFGGPVKVEVTVDANAITAVTVTEHQETEGVGTKAIDALPGAIVDANSVDVDDIAGATVSSTAIKTAVADALKQASGDDSQEEAALKDGTYTAEA